MPDAVDRLAPGLAVGERVTLVVGCGPAARDVIGFVTSLDPARMTVTDAAGRAHEFDRAAVTMGHRVGVSLGRNPARTPRTHLDALAAASHAPGEPYVARISDLLAGRPFPAEVPDRGEWACFDGVRARHDGEWVTLADASADVARAAAWWATRMGARSVQVRVTDPAGAADLLAAGFLRIP